MYTRQAKVQDATLLLIHEVWCMHIPPVAEFGFIDTGLVNCTCTGVVGAIGRSTCHMFMQCSDRATMRRATLYPSSRKGGSHSTYALVFHN